MNCWTLLLNSFFISGILVGCQAPPKKVQIEIQPPDVKTFIHTAPLQWTYAFVVKNTRPVADSSRDESLQTLIDYNQCLPKNFLANGQKLILVCNNPLIHSNSEIYLFDMASKKLRRLTYHDQDAYDPTVYNDHIFFASATDEIKENSDRVFDQLADKYLPAQSSESLEAETANLPALDFPNTEIYSLDILTGNINRLTQSTGYDGSADFSTRKKSLFYFSRRKNHLELKSMNSNGRRTRSILSLTNDGFQLSVSPQDSSIAWVTLDENKKRSRIEILPSGQNKITTLPLPPGQYFEPRWSPDGEFLVFSSRDETEKIFSIFSVKKDGSCFHRWTRAGRFDFSPVFSPDGKSVFFSRWKPTHFEVNRLTFDSAKACSGS